MGKIPLFTDSLNLTLRDAVEGEIERLIALLDAIDGDDDLEDDGLLEDCGDAEPDSDGEPWLGWITPDAGRIVHGGDADLEVMTTGAGT